MNRVQKTAKCNINRPVVYEIRLQGRLDRDWSNWLEGMQVTHEGDDTILTGEIIDQSALRGILSKVWDLNQTLISINRLNHNSNL